METATTEPSWFTHQLKQFYISENEADEGPYARGAVVDMHTSTEYFLWRKLFGEALLTAWKLWTMRYLVVEL